MEGLKRVLRLQLKRSPIIFAGACSRLTWSYRKEV